MEKIHAWINDPTRSLLRRKNDRALCFELYCPDKEKCDVYTQCNACISTGIHACKLGQKRRSEGFTPRARKFHTWMADKRKSNEGFMGDLTHAPRRIFKVIDHWYLPYSFIHGVWGSGYALKSEWVLETEMDAALLKKICTAKPRSAMGGHLAEYQEKSVPKLIADLHMHYPDLFALLSDEQKARLEAVNYVGRKVDVTTCPPGTYNVGENAWQWDGTYLTAGRERLLFPPCKGDVEIRVTPKPGSEVAITDNSQVTPKTVFLD